MKLLLGSIAVMCTLAVQSHLSVVVPEAPRASVARDLAHVAEQGTLRVALQPGPSRWSLEEGDPRGFETDLLERFARAHGLRLEVRAVTPEVDPCIWLSEGQVDVVGMRGGAPLACDVAVVAVARTPFAPGSAPLALRPSSPELVSAMNRWLGEQDGLRRVLSARYFTRVHADQPDQSTDRADSGPGYEPLFRDGAAELGWDWRMIAAQAYQESRWEPEARSSAGAAGLMQLMPGTAAMLGVTERTDPEDNVRGAVAYLERLEDRWRGRVASDDLLSFVLASYNAGPGHVEDAARLARAYGDDPRSWDDVRVWLLRKSDPAWAADPVVQHGRSDGEQAVTYVDAILERYGHYRHLLPA